MEIFDSLDTLVVTNADNSDKSYLMDLRLATMTSHLLDMGLNYSESQHLKRVDYLFEHFYIISFDDIKVGAIKFYDSGSELTIVQLQIHPSHQDKGFGSQIIQCIINHANYIGKRVHLSVLKLNPAKTLYEKFGFKVIDEDEFEFHLIYSKSEE